MEIEEFHLKIEISWGRYDANRQKSVNFVGSEIKPCLRTGRKNVPLQVTSEAENSVMGGVESSWEGVGI